MNTILFAAIALCATGGDAGLAAVALEFKDVKAHDGRKMVHYRAIEFRAKPVQPLKGDFAATPGASYGQLPVGPSPETALGVVWLPKADGGPTLWFDANGDGRFMKDERHVLSKKETELPATITIKTKPEVKKVSRKLLFRRPVLGSGLRYAVRGYATGKLKLGSDEHEALLVDGNADGCLNTVGRDRVWLDLNRDGRFDGLVEQFPLGKPILKQGQVYVIRGDAEGKAVCANHRKPGDGKLRLKLPDGMKVEKISAELISDLGELVELTKSKEATPVPHGKYRLSWLKLQVADADGRAWHYTFRSNKRKDFSVGIGKQATVSLLQKIDMRVSLDVKQGKVEPSQTFTVRPQVTADSNTLYLSGCTVGGENRSNSIERSAEILLLSPKGKTVTRGVSGFS